MKKFNMAILCAMALTVSAPSWAEGGTTTAFAAASLGGGALKTFNPIISTALGASATQSATDYTALATAQKDLADKVALYKSTPNATNESEVAKAAAAVKSAQIKLNNQNKLTNTLTGINANAKSVANTIANKGMPITATSSLTSKTSAKSNKLFESGAFTNGAQIINTNSSETIGSSVQQGGASAASTNASSQGLTGANLINAAKALVGTDPLKVKGAIKASTSGAMLLSDTSTKGGAKTSFIGTSGSLGNTTSSQNQRTMGAQVQTGPVTGSTSGINFIGNNGSNS